MSRRGSFPRVRKDSGKLGRFISPEPVSDSSSLQNMLGFFHDYIPQAYAGSKHNKERVVWARLETSDCNDVSMEQHCGFKDDSNLPLLLLLGLSTSFSVWIIPPGGDAREVYTYNSDTVRVATLLQSPEKPDMFVDNRPIIAVVKKSNSSRALFSSLSFISLSSTKGEGNEVKKLEFERNSIIDVKCNRRVVVVVLQKRLVLLDAATLEQKYVIKTGHQSFEHWTNPIALGIRWLAISDSKLYSYIQSVGGVSEHLTPPVASTVMNTVKKGFAAISDTISGLTGRTQSVQSSCVTNNEVIPSYHAVVTVLDILYPHNGEVQVSELRKSEGIVAHFLAHSSTDVCITAMSFNKSGELLFTADSEGQCFNIFKVLSRFEGPQKTFVQHLYSLYRGSTTGKVQDVCFSNDSRWIAVSTLNGTTHIFPISSYGGDITTRTHTSSHVVNQLSRFHTSAGISSGTSSSLNLPPAPPPAPPPTPLSSNASKRNILPCTIMPLQQIKQPYTSGPLNVPPGTSSSTSSSSLPDDGLSICVKAVFTSSSDTRITEFNDHTISNYSLYVLGGNGDVIEYMVEPRKASTANEGSDAPVELIQSPKLCWRLLSKLSEEITPLPLDEDNPLIMAHNEYKNCLKMQRSSSSSLNEGVWLSEVELLTYAPPTRRLWMGPQFAFKPFSEKQDRSDSERDDPISPTPVLPAIHDISELMGVSHLDLKSLHTSPLSMNCLSLVGGKEEPIPGSDPDSINTGVEVFGSWKDIAPKLKSEPDLEQKILDAMKDGCISPPGQSKPLITLVSSHSTHTGFQSSF